MSFPQAVAKTLRNSIIWNILYFRSFHQLRWNTFASPLPPNQCCMDFDMSRWVTRNNIERGGVGRANKALIPLQKAAFMRKCDFLGECLNNFANACSYLNTNKHQLQAPCSHSDEGGYASQHNFRKEENRLDIIFFQRMSLPNARPIQAFWYCHNLQDSAAHCFSPSTCINGHKILGIALQEGCFVK